MRTLKITVAVLSAALMIGFAVLIAALVRQWGNLGQDTPPSPPLGASVFAAPPDADETIAGMVGGDGYICLRLIKPNSDERLYCLDPRSGAPLSNTILRPQEGDDT